MYGLFKKIYWEWIAPNFLQHRLFVPVVKCLKSPPDYRIAWTWGDHISWFPRTQFDDWSGQKNRQFVVVGHKWPHPRAGQTVVDTFKCGRQFVFEFVAIAAERNPPDMFWGTVRPIAIIDPEADK